MGEDLERRRRPGEEIEGAPPAESDAEMQQRRRRETVSLNRYLYQHTHQLVHMLLQSLDLQQLVESLLVALPRHFSMGAAELWLYDPETVIGDLIVGAERYGESLQLYTDAFPVQELYDIEPDVELIDATDSRMFEVLKTASGIQTTLLVPLTDEGRVIGSLHLGIREEVVPLGKEEKGLLSHLALVISACLKTAVSSERISQLTLLDPLTEISNPRGFEKDLAREIARAGRAEQALSVLVLEIDDFEALYSHYGERRGNFVVRKAAERLSSVLRQTDLLARLTQSEFAVLLPNTDEVLGQEIADRMRADIENFLIDDGRGAILQVSLSIGMVTWEPRHYPAVDMERLASQIQSAGENGLHSAKSQGGNCVARARLSTIMV